MPNPKKIKRCVFSFSKMRALKKFMACASPILQAIWSKGKGQGLSPDLWQKPLADVAYFQSLFIGKSLRARVGEVAFLWPRLKRSRPWVQRRLSRRTGNKSRRTIRRELWGSGFQTVAVHPLYWKDVDYNCMCCLKPPCQCTAEEMIKYSNT